MKKRDKSLPCSHEEFESLPEPLRRKYFSSLERLRIEEDHARHDASSTRPSTRASASSRVKALPLPLTLPLPSSVHRRRRRRRAPASDHHLALADASFFLSLPPKIQRSVFSREEQVLLVGSLRSPSPPRLLRDERRRLRDFHFGFNSNNTTNSLGSGDLPQHQHDVTPRGRSLTRRRSNLSSPAVSPTRRSPSSPVQVQVREQFIDLDTESSLLYLDTMSPRPLSSRPSRSSFRRTLSLTHHPRTSTSSAPLPYEPQPGPTTPTWHQRAHSHSVSGRRSSRSSHLPVAPVFDPEATHYRDAETRKKLQFLASPQKFDEAVEFGFPSMGADDAAPHRYQLPPISTDSRNFSRDMQTFLKDDNVSFFEDNNEEDDNKGLDSDAESTPDFESPVTPSSAVLPFRSHSRQQSSNFSSSMDSNGVPLLHPFTGRLNREMTLRMTLTRPDLRADEDQLYGWQGQRSIKDDPFALEDLPLSDDMNGTKGPFYVKPKPQGNLVTRLFKRASKKGR